MWWSISTDSSHQFHLQRYAVETEQQIVCYAALKGYIYPLSFLDTDANQERSSAINKECYTKGHTYRFNV